jgi:hypothetical protein
LVTTIFVIDFFCRILVYQRLSLEANEATVADLCAESRGAFASIGSVPAVFLDSSRRSPKLD